MVTSHGEQFLCHICDGKLTAASHSINLEHTASFNRTWICADCGAKFVERVEVEKTGEEEAGEEEAGEEEIDSTSKSVIGKPGGFSPEQSEVALDDEIDRDTSDSNLPDWMGEMRRQREEREEKEAERKRQIIHNAEQMGVDWRAPYGTVIGQGEEFIVAQTLRKNQFTLINKRDGENIKTVQLVDVERDNTNLPEEEWDSDDIPENVTLHPSGTLSLRSRPGWEPRENAHWCVGDKSLFTFDDKGVRRHSVTSDELEWAVEDELLNNQVESRLCCVCIDRYLFVASDKILATIQIDDGSVIWSRGISDPDEFRLLVDPETIYLYNNDEIVSIQTESGNENWNQKLGDRYREQRLRHVVGIEQGILVTVEESDTHYVCGYDVESGEKLWTFQDRRTLSVMHVEDGLIYVNGDDGVLLALELSNGLLQWQHQFRLLDIRHGDHKTRAWPDRSNANFLTVTEKGVVTCNWSGGVYLIDPQTGKKEWEIYPENADVGPETACKVVEGAVVRIKGTQVEGFDLVSGEQKWSFETNDEVLTDTRWGTPVAASDTVYFTDYQGAVYGVKGDGLKKIFSSDREVGHGLAVDSKRVYVASLSPSADIPAYKRAEKAGTETGGADIDQSLLSLFALSH